MSENSVLAPPNGHDHGWPPPPGKVYAPGECVSYHWCGHVIAADLYGRRVFEMPGAADLLAGLTDDERSTVDESGDRMATRWIGPYAAARRLGVNRSELRRLRAVGLPYHVVAGRPAYDLRSLVAWSAARRSVPTRVSRYA
jgi:hypothetical protein